MAQKFSRLEVGGHMNYDNMTLKMQECIQDAASFAQQNDHSEIGSEHLLHALIAECGQLTKLGMGNLCVQNVVKPLQLMTLISYFNH